MRLDCSTDEGREIMGKVETVLSRGRVILDGPSYVGKAGDGVYLKRGTISVGAPLAATRTRLRFLCDASLHDSPQVAQAPSLGCRRCGVGWGYGGDLLLKPVWNRLRLLACGCRAHG
jgi:hypothetical protein